ncbi:MAG: hypothetical protein FJ083_02480 [Cyanobacteria bacterium K_Offshore_surface_m2_239]|nr:hypothetical protein [Cyanobacteria bacterium K_Offshore_surface_m2_239]
MKRLPPAMGRRQAIQGHEGILSCARVTGPRLGDASGGWLLPLRPLLLGILLVASGAPLPGWTEPKRYDPDLETCQAEVIRRAYKANLLPWEDQPPVVQERLRQLQAAMTLDTLRNCQARGLLSPSQASSLATELQLSPPSSSPTVTPAAASSPTRP